MIARYVVLICGAHDEPCFMTSSIEGNEERPAMFATEALAEMSARMNSLARARGYMVIAWPFSELP